jgi:REP element-mobilizing transposase RayT
MIRFDHYTQFLTITNLNWLPVLQNDYHKQIVIEALKRRIDQNQVSIYAFVIMPNHMHFLWQLHDGVNKAAFQRDLLKFTTRSISKFMLMNDDPLLQQLQVKAADRQQQVWERNSLGIDIRNENVLIQKMNYIHNNPVQPKWKLAAIPEDYKFSSALFNETGNDEFCFLKHYNG